MDKENQDFYNLLASVIEKQTFPVTLSNGTLAQFKPLTTAQLKNIIKTVVDSSLTQIQFSSAMLNVMKECYVGSNSDVVESFNIVDKLLFIIETRIQSISSTITIEDGENVVTLKLEDIKQALTSIIENNKELLLDQEIKSEDISLIVGIPTLKVEQQVDEEIYKNADLNLDDAEHVRKLLGEAFIIELAKSVKLVTIGDQKMDLSAVSFKERQKIVETLPSSLIQKVITYVENYKQQVNNCLVVDGHTLTIDGSLFSIR